MTAPAQNPPAPQAMAAFADPAAVGGKRPAIRDLVGRVVVIRPTRYEPAAPGIRPGETQERVTADILVVTGGPMEFGGNMVTKKVPNTYRVQVPYLAKGVMISNTNIVASVRDYTGKAPVLGRVVQGKASDPTFNDPYNLLTIASTEPDYAAAGQLYAQVLNDVFANPTPETIGAAPAAQAQTTYVAPAPAPAPAAPVIDPAAAFQAWLEEQNRKTAPAAAEEIPPPPAGWLPDVWKGLSAEQRTQVLAGSPF